MENFEKYQADLNRDLNQLIAILDELLPRYSLLLEKRDITSQELTELGTIEHYLIEVNSKITLIKTKLGKDLFGHSLEVYYRLKTQNIIQQEDATFQKLEQMRNIFSKSLKEGIIFNWN